MSMSRTPGSDKCVHGSDVEIHLEISQVLFLLNILRFQFPYILLLLCVKGKGMFYIAQLPQYPVKWMAQSALHFTPCRPVHSDTNSTSLGNILAMQQLPAKTIQS